MKNNETIRLEDAARLTGPAYCNVLLKPAGSLCNLNCSYCYYLDKVDIYGGREPKMDLDTLETCIKEYIQANDVDEVAFNWHGGEPLVMGLDFFKKALELEHKYAGSKKITNTLQTNGTLITSEFAEFFRENDFLIGISIDGPQDIHDKYRKDKGGAPTFAKVINGMEKLYRSGVQYNTMTTINKESAGRGLEVYKFLKSLGTAYMQFMPVLEHVKYPLSASGKPNRSARPYIVNPNEPDSVIAPWSVGARDFGKFMCDIFDYWVRNDVGRYFVNLFDCTLANWMGVTPGTCAYAETCGYNAIIEHNGDVYSCDHFVYPEYKIGNLIQTPMRDMMKDIFQFKFGIDKREGLPYQCRKCQWFFLCHGECPKHRFNKTESGETGLNALCEGYSMFYSHTAKSFKRMKELLLEEKAPAMIMFEK